MANHPNRSTLNVILAVCEANRIAAGARKDGCGVAHIQPVLHMLDALAASCGDLASPRYARIAEVRDAARTTKLHCEIHDRAAREELIGDAYTDALVTLRART